MNTLISHGSLVAFAGLALASAAWLAFGALWSGVALGILWAAYIAANLAVGEYGAERKL